MNISFERDLSHNYMIPEIEEKTETDEYQIHMLTENRIKGLLECTVKRVNCREQYFYEITSRQSLDQICENGKLKTEDIRKILKGLQMTLQEVEKYLLDENHVVLEPKFIYLDMETDQVWFCYLPVFDGVLTKSFRSLTSFFLYHIDQTEQKAVLLGYQIYRMSMEENYSLLKLLQTAVEETETPAERSLKEEPERKKVVIEPVKETDVPKIIKKPQSGRKNRRKVLFGVSIIGIMLLAGLAAWAEILTVTQAGGIAFLLTGLIGYARTFQKKQQAEKKKDPGAAILKRERKAERERKKREEDERRKETQGEQNVGMSGETMVLREAQEEYTPHLTLLSMNSRDRNSIVLLNESYLVGKLKSKADIFIDDPAVSRIHAKIQKNGEDYYLCDMNSTNGTFINGRRLGINEKVLLKVSDEIAFAETGYYVGKC